MWGADWQRRRGAGHYPAEVISMLSRLGPSAASETFPFLPHSGPVFSLHPYSNLTERPELPLHLETNVWPPGTEPPGTETRFVLPLSWGEVGASPAQQPKPASADGASQV